MNFVPKDQADQLENKALALIAKALSREEQDNYAHGLYNNAQLYLDLAAKLRALQTYETAPTAPEWVPTHRHFKGELYRVIYRDLVDATNTNDGPFRHYVLYENQHGEKFIRHDVEFDAWVKLPTDKPGCMYESRQRFAPIK